MATKCELEAKRILKYLNSDEMKMLFGEGLTWCVCKNGWNEFAYDIHPSLQNSKTTIPIGYARKISDFTIGCGLDISIATVNGWMDNERFSIPCFRISKH